MRLLAFSEIQNSQLYLPSMHSPISLGLLVVTEKLGRSVENHRCFGLGTTVDPPEFVCECVTPVGKYVCQL